MAGKIKTLGKQLGTIGKGKTNLLERRSKLCCPH